MTSLVPPGATEIIANLYGVGSDGSRLANPSSIALRGSEMDEALDDWLSEAMPVETGYRLRDVEVGDRWPDARGHYYADIRDLETDRVVASLRIYPDRKAISYPAVDLSVRREDLEAIGRAA